MVKTELEDKVLHIYFHEGQLELVKEAVTEVLEHTGDVVVTESNLVTYDTEKLEYAEYPNELNMTFSLVSETLVVEEELESEIIAELESRNIQDFDAHISQA